MVKVCSAVGCHNRHQTGSSISFHKFPMLNKTALAKWLDNMRRANFTPTDTSFICSDHFDKSCYWKGHTSNILKQGSIPTIFNFQGPNTGYKRFIPLPLAVDKKLKEDIKNKPLHNMVVKRSLRLKNKSLKSDLISKVKSKKNKLHKSTDEIVNEEIIKEDVSDAEDCRIAEISSDSEDGFALIKDKYVRADHTYVKTLSNNQVSDESLDTIAKGHMTDANMLEAISEMGKTNAVILVVEDKVKNKNAIIKDGNCTNSKCVEAEVEVKNEPFEEVKSDVDDSEIVADETTGFDNKSDSIEGQDEMMSDEIEPGEVKGADCPGVLGKSNAQFIKILLKKDWKLFDRLLTTIDEQKLEIEALKESLDEEGSTRKQELS